MRQVVGRSDAVVPGRRRASAGRQYHGTTEQLHLPNLTERHVTPIGVGSRASPHSADVDANWGTAAEEAKERTLREGSLSMAPVLSHGELSDDFRLRSLGTATARGDLFSDPRIHFGLDPADGAGA